jgi:hypothetical protein
VEYMAGFGPYTVHETQAIAFHMRAQEERS